MSSFYVIRGKDNGKHFPIRGGAAQIGRGSNCAIQLNDTEVSRQHAMVVRTSETEHDIVDNSSSNGTYLNSRRITRATLNSGDRVQIGRTLLIYTGGPEPGGSTREVAGADSSQSPGHSSSEKANVEVVAGQGTEDLSRITGSLESHAAWRLSTRASSSATSKSKPPSTTQPPDPAKDSNRIAPGRVAPESSISADNVSKGTASEEAVSGGTVSGGVVPERVVSSAETIAHTGSVSDDGSAAGDERDSGAPREQSDWEIVYEVSQAVRRTLDLDELLHQVAQLIFDWIQCDRGCILLIDEATGNLRPAFSSDNRRVKSSPSREPIRISKTILDHVTETRESVMTSNAQDDSRWENAESIASIGVHEAICVPMLGRYGLVGIVYVDTRTSPGEYAQRQQAAFNHQHMKIMLAIAGQAALAIEDTQFYRAMLQSERLAAMGQTIANLSHHVKNILQGIKGGSFLVEDGIDKEKLDVVQRGWAIVDRNQQRISNLVMDMLSFSKEREPQVQESDLRQVVQEVVSLMSTRASDMGISLQLLDGDNLLADFDRDGMHQALLNVITNAIDASAEAAAVSDEVQPATTDSESGLDAKGSFGGPAVIVRVGLDESDEHVFIEVDDSGPGIPAADAESIFVPFESSKGARGTGLGLPVSRKVLREHGGDISVRNLSSGGASFRLHWPRHNTDSDIPSPTQDTL